MEEIDSDASKPYNVDYKGVTLNRDGKDSYSRKYILSYGNSHTSQLRAPSFRNVRLLTLIATVCANDSN